MSKNNTVLIKYLLLVTSCIEGGVLMGLELISAKYLTPYYGNSLYVWSSVLAFTLGGLALGYFIGGFMSRKFQPMLILAASLFGCFVMLLGLPFYSQFILEYSMAYSLITGINISCLIIIAPIVCMLGMTSPLIIGILSNKDNEVGNVAGTVYGISTCGGILFTYLYAFYFIPYKGLNYSSWTLSGLMLLITLIVLFAKQNTQKHQ